MGRSAGLLWAACTSVLALLLLCGSSATAQCVGDCNGDEEVAINELVTGVNIALGNADLTTCPEFDENRDGECAINELITAVNNALDGCPEIVGELIFDKISVAVFLNGTETISVTANDENGEPDGWEVTSSDDGIIEVEKSGDVVIVSGVSLGEATITVTTDSGRQRSLPVQVYDHSVLDVGEILLKYVDTFDCRWYNLHGDRSGSFYHPVVPEGWHALGSLGVRARGCPSADGYHAMIVVKADEAEPHPLGPPLIDPTDYEEEWAWYYNIFGIWSWGRFWTPICDDGYVAMGSVVTGTFGFPGETPTDPGLPSPDDVTCVREDLTRIAEAGDTIWNDKGTGGEVPYQGSFRLVVPEITNWDTSTIYLEAGTFVTQGQFRSCQGEGCWSPPPRGGHEVMNVLAVELPMLIDNPYQNWQPRLTSFAKPPLFSDPFMQKGLLVPFTAVLSGNEYTDRGVGWMVDNSPFVRVDRVTRWKRLYHEVNNTSVAQNPTIEFTKGITTEESTTVWESTGISITAEAGVQFKGFGAKISCTVSRQFGYSTQQSVSEFEEKKVTQTISHPAGKAAAVWGEHTNFLVRLHDAQVGEFYQIKNVDLFDAESFALDEFPD